MVVVVVEEIDGGAGQGVGWWWKPEWRGGCGSGRRVVVKAVGMGGEGACRDPPTHTVNREHHAQVGGKLGGRGLASLGKKEKQFCTCITSGIPEGQRPVADWREGEKRWRRRGVRKETLRQDNGK